MNYEKIRQAYHSRLVATHMVELAVIIGGVLAFGMESLLLVILMLSLFGLIYKKKKALRVKDIKSLDDFMPIDKKYILDPDGLLSMNEITKFKAEYAQYPEIIKQISNDQFTHYQAINLEIQANQFYMPLAEKN